MILFSLHPKSINTEEFQRFIKLLSERFSGKPFALFLDNLSVHKTNVSKELLESLGIKSIFNVPYSPQFNGIESYFSLLKAEYKKLLLRQIVKKESADSVGMIKMAIKLVNDDKTKRCVEYGLRCI